MEAWIIILIIALVILVGYFGFYFLYIEKHKKELHSLTQEHEVHKPHSHSESLKEFMEDCWSRGFSIPEIKEILVEKGWNPDTIDEMFYKSEVPNEAEEVTRLKRKLIDIADKKSKD